MERKDYIYPESETRRRVRELTEEGWTAVAIAAELRITTQRVYQQRRRIREAAREKAS